MYVKLMHAYGDGLVCAHFPDAILTEEAVVAALTHLAEMPHSPLVLSDEFQLANDAVHHRDYHCSCSNVVEPHGQEPCGKHNTKQQSERERKQAHSKYTAPALI